MIDSSLYTRLIVFGDSHSDGGAAAHGVYVVTGGAWPGPPYAEGRFCNGPVWPEYLAPRLGFPYIPADNYAVGGACTGLSNIMQGKEFCNTGVLAQAQAYVRTYPRIDPRALICIMAGGANLLPDGSEVQRERVPLSNVVEVVELAMQDYAEVLDLLSQAGARTVVMMTFISMLHCPRYQQDSGKEELHQRCVAFDTQLARFVDRQRDEFARRVYLVNIGSFAGKVVANPDVYGLRNVHQPCLVDDRICQDPDRYVFWDELHLTTAMHALIAERVDAAISRAELREEESSNHRVRLPKAPAAHTVSHFSS